MFGFQSIQCKPRVGSTDTMRFLPKRQSAVSNYSLNLLGAFAPLLIGFFIGHQRGNPDPNAEGNPKNAFSSF